ncbi:class I SAM-dependent methyltransferase [Gordonia sp. ABSL49_1]|uniref:class I SAM-dependent DNA methyltransferase n=1 Tax=Gordonia sp. ABSL49_1 TaxID=2920941 RepID=UPI001F1146BB|nr:SAM-dependent methyltransferase [Gordonia sp. ABSL49_1]MCH5643360.1 nodulation S family protein [Gordonia sp. ABSL49_1]
MSTPGPDVRGNLPRSYFDAMYESSDDPWGFASRWYEQRKYGLTLAMLSSPRYQSAFEPGCSIGVLSQALAARCDRLLCTDVSERAVDLARERLRGADHVCLQVGDAFTQWPATSFDLIVVSELLYYHDEQALPRLIARLAKSLTPRGELVAVHWRHHVAEYPSSGDAVHDALSESPGLSRRATYTDSDFRADSFTRRDTQRIPWVAERDGLVGTQFRRLW